MRNSAGNDIYGLRIAKNASGKRSVTWKRKGLDVCIGDEVSYDEGNSVARKSASDSKGVRLEASCSQPLQADGLISVCESD
jgi:hypothetical protein